MAASSDAGAAPSSAKADGSRSYGGMEIRSRAANTSPTWKSKIRRSFVGSAARGPFSPPRCGVLDSEARETCQMIKIRGFAHSALRITDADRAIAFYENVLGLKRLGS